MTEWLVSLSPLALLPIVLLFGFVGCQLNTSGSPSASVTLIIGEGLDTGVESVEVIFQYRLYDSGEAPSDLRVGFTLEPSDLVEGTVFDKTGELDVSGEPKGTLTCTCEITKTEPSGKIELLSDQFYDHDYEDSGLSAFILSRKNDDFQLVPKNL